MRASGGIATDTMTLHPSPGSRRDPAPSPSGEELRRWSVAPRGERQGRRAQVAALLQGVLRQSLLDLIGIDSCDSRQCKKQSHDTLLFPVKQLLPRGRRLPWCHSPFFRRRGFSVSRGRFLMTALSMAMAALVRRGNRAIQTAGADGGEGVDDVFAGVLRRAARRWARTCCALGIDVPPAAMPMPPWIIAPRSVMMSPNMFP